HHAAELGAEQGPGGAGVQAAGVRAVLAHVGGHQPPELRGVRRSGVDGAVTGNPSGYWRPEPGGIVQAAVVVGSGARTGRVTAATSTPTAATIAPTGGTSTLTGS